MSASTMIPPAEEIGDKKYSEVSQLYFAAQEMKCSIASAIKIECPPESFRQLAIKDWLPLAQRVLDLADKNFKVGLDTRSLYAECAALDVQEKPLAEIAQAMELTVAQVMEVLNVDWRCPQCDRPCDLWSQGVSGEYCPEGDLSRDGWLTECCRVLFVNRDATEYRGRNPWCGEVEL